MDKIKALAACLAVVLVGLIAGAIGLDAAVTTHLTSGHIWVGSALNVQADVPCSGDLTCSNTGAITIGNAKVSYAKLQNEGAVSLLGNPTGSPAAPSEITLGSGLNFSGTTLVATGSGGTLTSLTCNGGLTGGAITTTGTCALDVAHANEWSAAQTFDDGDLILKGSGSGSSTLKAPATGGGTATLPAGSGTLAYVGGSGVGTVTSVTCGTGLSGGTFTTTGTCALDLAHANSWSGVQTFGDGDLVLSGSGSGSSTLKAPATGGGTATLPAGSGTLVYAAGAGTVTSITCDAGLTGGTITTTGTCELDINHANTWTAVQTFTNSDIRLLGSSTGYTTFTSDNAGASNFTLHFPAANDTLAALGTVQSFTAAQAFAEVHGTTETVTLTSNNYNAVVADCGKTKLLPTGTAPTVTLPNISPASGSCTITFVTTVTKAYLFNAASGGSKQNSQGFYTTRGTAAGDTVSVILVTPSVSAAVWNVAGDVTS